MEELHNLIKRLTLNPEEQSLIDLIISQIKRHNLHIIKVLEILNPLRPLFFSFLNKKIIKSYAKIVFETLSVKYFNLYYERPIAEIILNSIYLFPDYPDRYNTIVLQEHEFSFTPESFENRDAIKWHGDNLISLQNVLIPVEILALSPTKGTIIFTISKKGSNKAIRSINLEEYLEKINHPKALISIKPYDKDTIHARFNND